MFRVQLELGHFRDLAHVLEYLLEMGSLMLSK